MLMLISLDAITAGRRAARFHVILPGFSRRHDFYRFLFRFFAASPANITIMVVNRPQHSVSFDSPYAAATLDAAAFATLARPLHVCLLPRVIMMFCPLCRRG